MCPTASRCQAQAQQATNQTAVHPTTAMLCSVALCVCALRVCVSQGKQAKVGWRCYGVMPRAFGWAYGSSRERSTPETDTRKRTPSSQGAIGQAAMRELRKQGIIEGVVTLQKAPMSAHVSCGALDPTSSVRQNSRHIIWLYASPRYMLHPLPGCHWQLVGRLQAHLRHSG